MKPPPVTAEERLLTSVEVAALMGVDRKTVNRWTRIGLLDHGLTPGGHLRYREADIYALLDADSDRPVRAVPADDPAVLAALGLDDTPDLEEAL